jgi:uncharacterized protein YecT (DUF1311 family)
MASSAGTGRLAIGAIILLIAASLRLVAQQPSKTTDADPQRACNDAKSQMELNQCAGEQYQKADTRLNLIYGNVVREMQKDLADAKEHKDTQQIEYEETAIEKLRAAEKAWIAYRDLHCEAAEYQYQGGSMRPMIWNFCMAQVILDRIGELKSAYEDGDRKLE